MNGSLHSASVFQRDRMYRILQTVREQGFTAPDGATVAYETVGHGPSVIVIAGVLPRRRIGCAKPAAPEGDLYFYRVYPTLKRWAILSPSRWARLERCEFEDIESAVSTDYGLATDNRLR
jgi:hypothetical protein